MRFVAPLAVAFAASAAGLTINVGSKCIDITKPIPVTWDKGGDPAVGPQLTFSLWNMMGAWPTVNDPFPIGNPPPLSVDSSLNKYSLPAATVAQAEAYRKNNNGKNYQIRVNTPETYSQPFDIAAPGGGC